MSIRHLALASLFVCSTAQAAGWETLDQARAREVFSDITATHRDFVIYYSGDGIQRGRFAGGTHTGTFRIDENGHVCSRWDDFRESHKEEGCWSYQIKGNKMRANPVSGRANKSYGGIKFKEGNTKGL